MLKGLLEKLFCGQGEHQSGEATEEHADTYEGSDGPDGAIRPGAPDHKSQNESDDAVDDQPGGAFARTDLEGVDELDDACDEKIDGEQERE